MWAKLFALVALVLLVSGCAIAPRPFSAEEQLWFLLAVGPEADPLYNEKYEAIVLGYPRPYPAPEVLPGY